MSQQTFDEFEFIRNNPKNPFCECGRVHICTGCRDLAPFILHWNSDTGRWVRCISPTCIEAGGGSVAKQSPPPVAADRTMRQDNGQALRDMHIRLPAELVKKIKVCAAREDESVSFFLSQVIFQALANNPS